MLRKAILLAAAVLCAAPAFAPAFADDHRGRGRGHDKHYNDRNWDRGRNHDRNYSNNYYYRDYYRPRTTLSLGFIFGGNRYSDYGYDYDRNYDRYSEPGYYNSWRLGANQCRWDREYGYWYGRSAEVEVQHCANRYGEVYVVQGSHRLWRYR